MRTHYCTDLTPSHTHASVSVCGWVHTHRNLGGLIFLDLRDRSGIVQVVFEPEFAELFQLASKLHHEYVIRIEGVLRARPDNMINDKMKTGRIEILAQGLTILNTAEPVPLIPSDEHQNIHDDLRYRYRYLDLRRAGMQYNIALRHRLVAIIREYFNEQGFFDIETPMLTKATPEGARDYLVPSREYPGSFYALPQSPQLFKQLLMMSGFDKYYQIVRCFRDEDLRADRQPEFTQLDVEMSFISEEHIIQLIEPLLKRVFKTLLNVDIADKLPRMSYAEAMRRYGSDKPDLRIPMELIDIHDLVKDCDFQVFSAVANGEGGRIAALKVPGGSDMSRKQLDDYAAFVGAYGNKGLAYIKVNQLNHTPEGLQSPIVKFFSWPALEAILSRVNAQEGDIILFGAGPEAIINESLGALRLKIAQDRQLIQPGWKLLWVVDWPMFEKDSKTGKIQSMHHPFTSPQELNIDALKQQPTQTLAKAYDIVINGYEIGGGSIRIHRSELQKAVFELLELSEEEANQKFGFLLEALKYGCPPHGGIALGVDRLAMLLAGLSSIRDVIAFPKTQSAACLLTNAPAPVSDVQLKETGIKLA